MFAASIALIKPATSEETIVALHGKVEVGVSVSVGVEVGRLHENQADKIFQR